MTKEYRERMREVVSNMKASKVIKPNEEETRRYNTFKCPDCGEIFKVYWPMDTIAHCPKCGYRISTRK